MTLWEKIVAIYPELTDADFWTFGTIALQDDSDGKGAYIAKWDYSKPLPKGLKVGK
jgi:hypothetical protein